MPKPSLYDRPKFKEAVNEYFENCKNQVRTTIDKNGVEKIIHKPMTLTGLCLHLGICRDTFAEYAKREDLQDIVKFARLQVENFVEEKSLTGDINATTAIFNLKNNFGWKDKSETEISNKDGESFRIAQLSESEIDAKLQELLNVGKSNKRTED